MMTGSDKAWSIFNVIVIAYFLCAELIRFLTHNVGVHFYVDLAILFLTISNSRTINRRVEKSIEREAWIRSLYL